MKGTRRGKRDQCIDVSPQSGTGKMKEKSERDSLPVYSQRHGLGGRGLEMEGKRRPLQ